MSFRKSQSAHTHSLFHYAAPDFLPGPKLLRWSHGVNKSSKATFVQTSVSESNEGKHTRFGVFLPMFLLQLGIHRAFLHPTHTHTPTPFLGFFSTKAPSPYLFYPSFSTHFPKRSSEFSNRCWAIIRRIACLHLLRACSLLFFCSSCFFFSFAVSFRRQHGDRRFS